MKETEAIDQQARAILKSNDKGGYTIPTSGLYPYQWNWDSAFAALGFATFDLPRAWEELHTLFQGQWANGMVPHILFHQLDDGYFPGPDVWKTGNQTVTTGIASSGITQPPLVASFALKIYQQDPSLGLPHLYSLFPKLKRWHQWFDDNRSEQGAIVATHPWESGRDNSPDWDIPLSHVKETNVGDYQRKDIKHVEADARPTKLDYDRYLTILYQARDADWDQDFIRTHGFFWVADPTLTFILLRANKDLKKIAEILGEEQNAIIQWIKRIEEGCQQLWNPKTQAYNAFDFRSSTHSHCLSNASFLCWYAGLRHEEMMVHLERFLKSSKFVVPSCDPSSIHFDAKRYWRGPIWGIMNALIAMGLSDAGYHAFAETIRTQTATLIQNHGFAEYFSPQNGEPSGGQDFTWTASTWLAWASPSAERK